MCVFSARTTPSPQSSCLVISEVLLRFTGLCEMARNDSRLTSSVPCDRPGPSVSSREKSVAMSLPRLEYSPPCDGCHPPAGEPDKGEDSLDRGIWILCWRQKCSLWSKHIVMFIVELSRVVGNAQRLLLTRLLSRRAARSSLPRKREVLESHEILIPCALEVAPWEALAFICVRVAFCDAKKKKHE